ncbi:hypothetical protein [Agromyces bauzanensis]|nr:hypothetical protein [Agromyces bauzanensis]
MTTGIHRARGANPMGEHVSADGAELDGDDVVVRWTDGKADRIALG